MHHKRGRPRNRRAGCKMCKGWKISSAPEYMQLKPSENRLIQPEEGRPPKARKVSRRRWCKGKVGVEHELVCMTYEQAKGPLRGSWNNKDRFLVCKRCGKELEHYRGFGGEKNKPDWVDH